MKLLKKLRRRFRQKGLFGFSTNSTPAKELVYDDYGLDFSNPYPARAGQIRARIREDTKKQPKTKDTMTRQRRRQAIRKQIKLMKSFEKDKQKALQKK